MAFARVQGQNSATNAATFGAAVGSGSTVLGCYTFDNSGTFTTITDDKGNTYSVVTNILDTTNNQRAIYFALGNITNAPATITVNGAAGNAFQGLVIDEFSGGDAASNNRDGTTGQFQNTPGTSTDAITSGAITTTQAGDLIWGACVRVVSTTQPSVGTGFSLGTSEGTNQALRSEFLTQGAAGSVAATFTQGTASQTLTGVIAIKAAAGVTTPFDWIRQPNDLLRRKQTPSSQQALIWSGFTPAAPIIALDWLRELTPPRSLAARRSIEFPAFTMPSRIIVPPVWLQEFVRPLPRQRRPEGGYVNPYFVPPAQVVTLDWFEEYARPLPRPRPLDSGYVNPHYVPPAQAVTWGWYSPFTDPVRRKSRADELAVVLVPYIVTIPGDWQARLSEPTRRKPRVDTSLFAWSGFTPFAPLSIFGWFEPFTDPKRLRQQWQYTSQSFFAPSRVIPQDVVTVDKWFAHLSMPVRYRVFATALQQALAMVKAAPFGEIVTVASWVQSLSIPPKLGKIGLSVSAQMVSTIDPVTPPAPPPTSGDFTVSGRSVEDLFPTAGVNYTYAPITHRTN